MFAVECLGSAKKLSERNKNMKIIQLIALLGVTALTATQSQAAEKTAETNKPPAKEEQLFDDPVVAKGKGFEIKRSDLDEAFVQARASAAARGRSFSEAERDSLE